MPAPKPIPQAEIEAAVRAYLGRVARRYVPLVVGLVIFGLIVALVPTVNGKDHSSALRASESGPSAAAASGTADAATGGADGTATAGAADGAVSGAPAATRGSTGGSATNDIAVPQGITAPPPAGTRGVAKSGVSCGPGVRQVPWTAYSPLCVPAFAGNNGGATSHGVTKDTITVTYRKSQSTEDTAIYAAAGDAAPAPDNVFLADMRDYINLFNKTYELYGRKVVLKDFQGQGDYIQEDMGQGQAAAAGDAATAHDLGAFADVTFFLKGSQPFWTGLAQQKVVAVGPLGFPQSYYERNAPYWYSFRPTGSDGAHYLGNAICRREAGLPAVFAGDAGYQKTPRKFALITPENPEYLTVANETKAAVKRCGVSFTRQVSYAINVATFQTQATNIVTQLKAAGVTTVVCICDPIVPIFLSNTAQSQAYHPEWAEPWYRDPQGRLMNQQQWAHATADHGRLAPVAETESYKTFKLATGGPPRDRLYHDVSFNSLLLLFNGLQAAGPNLTPAAFERGLASLPTSLPGENGTYKYGPKTYSPFSDVQLGWWNPNRVSDYDGKKGSWESCEGGKYFPYDDFNAWGPLHTQLHCFGT